MAPRPNYDQDELIRILTEHPDWPRYAQAKALTEFNHAHGREVTVTTRGLISAIYNLRELLASKGVHTDRPATCPLVTELKRNTGHRSLSTDVNVNSVPLRRLRQVHRLSVGLPVADVEATKARNWETDMKLRRHVVDITDDGVPYTRPAEPWELDEDGNLRSLVTLPEPRQRKTA